MPPETQGTFAALAGVTAKARKPRVLTEEQGGICSVKLLPGQVMVINAFAGTGKTSTLEEYTHRHSDLTALYMAFNKTAAVDASQRFPATVKCSTTHALAMGDTGRQYSDANKLGEPKAKTIMRPLGIAAPAVANYVIETLNNWLHSADVELTWEHLPLFVKADPSFPAEVKEDVEKKARRLWTMMCDVGDRQIPMSHDGYLKLWQLKVEETGRLPFVFRRYDLVLLDEAQDTNPTMEAIVRRILEGGRHRLILVGDNRQNIYGFRGSVNLMQRVCDAIEEGKVSGVIRQLTESFRYTAKIAKVATEILNADAEKPSKKVEVKGRRPDLDSRCESEAIVGRSNGGLIAAAIEYIARNEGKRIHFAATSAKDNWDPTQLYRFDSMMGVYLHFVGRGQEGKDPYIRQFANYAEIQQHAKGDENGQGGDRELDGYVRLVDAYGAELPTLLDRIVSRCGPPEGAMCFSTAHRSKGLEWDKVTLLDDFAKACKMMSFDDPSGKDHPGREELNLLYVAATRPRKVLVMHPDLSGFMESRWGNVLQAKGGVTITTDPELEVSDTLYAELEEVHQPETRTRRMRV